MKLKMYLHSITPLLSSPHSARRLLWTVAAILLAGLLAGVYNFLLFTFNTELSQRRGSMSSAIAAGKHQPFCNPPA